MRQISCLRAEESGGYMTTYRVGETPAGMSRGEFVLEIKALPVEEGSGVIVDFDNGVRRWIPEHRVISLDMALEQKESP